ncbi:MAG: GNAT family N-acetyltransferase [Nocardioides sp.]
MTRLADVRLADAQAMSSAMPGADTRSLMPVTARHWSASEIGVTVCSPGEPRQVVSYDDQVRRKHPDMTDAELTHDAARKRYEARLGGQLAGFAEYELTGDLIVFTHTEVDPQFEGRGVGSAIARFALDGVRAEGTRKVLPICPFVKGWIQRHPDYRPVVYGVPASTARD